jgi:3-hydroxybutyrate dehydrogenase
MTQGCTGKVAVVTGAASGLGLVFARALAADGATVVLNDWDPVQGATAETAAAAIRSDGGTAIGVDADVRDFGAMKRLVDTAVEHCGGIDIVIANAGIDRLAPVHDMTLETWRAVTGVHVDGTFNVVHHAVPHLVARGSGTILTTGSAGAFVPMPRHLPYAAAKAALFGMNLVLAAELQPHDINVNSIWPGLARTSIVDDFAEDARVAGIMDEAQIEQFKASAQPPENVAPLVLHLCSAAGHHITGHTFSIMGDRLALVPPPSETEPVTTTSSRWTVAAVAAATEVLLARQEAGAAQSGGFAGS